MSVSLRSLFTLNQQSHQYSFLDEIEYTDYGSFFPCRYIGSAAAGCLLTGVSFFFDAAYQLTTSSYRLNDAFDRCVELLALKRSIVLFLSNVRLY